MISLFVFYLKLPICTLFFCIDWKLSVRLKRSKIVLLDLFFSSYNQSMNVKLNYIMLLLINWEHMQLNLERSWNSHNYSMFSTACEKPCLRKIREKIKLFSEGGFAMKEDIQKTKMVRTIWNNVGCETTGKLDFILWAELYYWRY